MKQETAIITEDQIPLGSVWEVRTGFDAKVIDSPSIFAETIQPNQRLEIVQEAETAAGFIRFLLAGTMYKSFPRLIRQHCRIVGNISAPKQGEPR